MCMKSEARASAAATITKMLALFAVGTRVFVLRAPMARTVQHVEMQLVVRALWVTARRPGLILGCTTVPRLAKPAALEPSLLADFALHAPPTLTLLAQAMRRAHPAPVAPSTWALLPLMPSLPLA